VTGFKQEARDHSARMKLRTRDPQARHAVKALSRILPDREPSTIWFSNASRRALPHCRRQSLAAFA
jgi:hypothetical protein